jgi:hypothetical protein
MKPKKGLKPCGKPHYVKCKKCPALKAGYFEKRLTKNGRNKWHMSDKIECRYFLADQARNMVIAGMVHEKVMSDAARGPTV